MNPTKTILIAFRRKRSLKTVSMIMIDNSWTRYMATRFVDWTINFRGTNLTLK